MLLGRDGKTPRSNEPQCLINTTKQNGREFRSEAGGGGKREIKGAEGRDGEG